MTDPHHLTSTAPGTPRRKSAETLPVEFFPLLARNVVLLKVVGWTGVITAVAFFALSVSSMSGADLPPVLVRLVVAVRFFSAALMLTPAIHLLRYQASIEKAIANPESDGLTLILSQQRRFWRFVGVALIVVFTLIATSIAAPHLLMFRDRDLS